MMTICRFLAAFSPFSVGTLIKQFPIPKTPVSKSIHIPTGKTIFTPNASASAALDNSHFQALTSHQRHQISLYMDSLLHWNQKMNLTAVKDENEAMERHVEDSLALVEPICSSYMSCCGSSFQNLSMVDVGSGAGLPGVILAIACPGWKVTLLESMNKRCVFLEHVVGSIGLPNVQVIRERAENLGQNPTFREGFDIAVARAVAEMRVLAEYCLPLVRVGGLFLAAKGHDPQEEVTRAERAIHLMGASLLQTCFVDSHSKYGQRTAIICRKNGPTPKKYPRVSDADMSYPLNDNVSNDDVLHVGKVKIRFEGKETTSL